MYPLSLSQTLPSPLTARSNKYYLKVHATSSGGEKCKDASYLSWQRCLIGSGTMLASLTSASQALAVNKELGILEGTSLALLHPAVMIGLFGLTLYAGYLGYQWRRLREIGNEIRELKKQMPASDAEGQTADPAVSGQISELEQKRKELSSGGFRDKHWVAGSILLGGGVSIAVFGCFNTFWRTGKLFPGPHLYSGAEIVVLWALAASLVPQMQKGNDAARSIHIGLNVLNVLLFASQIPTGFEIVGKVLESTTFP